MRSNKRQQAANVYFHTSLTQLQIAALLQIDPKTLRKWMEEGDWQRLKKSVGHLNEAVREQLYLLLGHLSGAMLASRSAAQPQLRQFARLVGCFNTLRRRHIVHECTEAFTHLADTIQAADPVLAAQLRPHIAAYLRQRTDYAYISRQPSEADRRRKLTHMVISSLVTSRPGPWAQNGAIKGSF